MADNFNYDDLADNYGLDPVPASVMRLTQLVARQDADLDQIAKVITQDQSLTQRLLRAANPRARSDEEFSITTVEDALMRTGMGCVLLLAMGTPLTLALARTFQTMLALKLESVHPKAVTQFPGEHLRGTIGFSGKAEGRVFLRLSPEGARRIAAGVLGMAPEELTDLSEIDDSVGELVNIVTGNFKSNLCDAGLDCRLTPPSVERVTGFDVPVVSGGGLERMAFRAPQITLFVDVTVNPWNED